MAAYPRAELEEMMKRWLDRAQLVKDGDWVKSLGPFYTEDATYSWNIGPNEEFEAVGRQQICEWAVGYQMKGFENWHYPYHDVIIDEKRGTVVAFWKQRAPVNRPDGSHYEVAGIGGSWFEYGGNYQWRWQRDFFDFGNAKALFFELAGAGHLSPVVKKKIHTQAKGGLLPGHKHIREPLGAFEKMRNFFAMARIAMFGT